MEKSLKKISKELKGASKMHQGQAERIDSLLNRKDNKSIAKMISKVKNPIEYSPAKLKYREKNLNQFLDTNYDYSKTEDKDDQSEEEKDLLNRTNKVKPQKDNSKDLDIASLEGARDKALSSNKQKPSSSAKGNLAGNSLSENLGFKI